MLKEPKIIFHHIPKCGGTSIVTSLAATYYPLRLLRYGRKGFPGALNARAASLTAQNHNKERYTFRRELLTYFAEKGDSPLISGHYPFNHEFFEHHKDQWNFITLLRHPLERWYSEYFWNRYKDHEYRKTDLEVEAYLQTDNGLSNTRSFVNFFSKSKETSSPATSQDVQDALETLENMNVVSCLEHMDHYNGKMKETFGRKPISITRNKSPASKAQRARPDKESDTHKTLLEWLQPDIEIYEKTKERLGL